MTTPSPVTGTLKSLLAYEGKNIRRPLFGGVFLAPESTPLPTTLRAANGQVTLPAAFESVGRISDEGLTFSMESEIQEVRGWGSTSVLRRDIQSLDVSLQFSMLETKRITYELFQNLDLSNVTFPASTDEVSWTMPSQPPTRYYRVIAIGADGDGANRFHMAKIFGRMSVTEMDDETWQASDEAPLMRNVTMGADEDDAAGGPYTELLFGPGAKAAAVRMGFKVAT